ncbi:MAG: hypothetical protein FWH20_11340 [Oscillospiraceae bacterium]|nr:hypothetical protein [Oscillospiraceae bacterium]
MNRRINLTGKNSNDIYTISYPKNLLYFMKYDFNLFMERSVDLCKLYIKTGEYRAEEAAEIRNSIGSCHKYFEQNLRGAFEKIVIDCWIEFICRQNEIGVITLWNNYIACKNDFEKAVFQRLSEYRHGHAINQWVNVLKLQEYANVKVDFVFSMKLKNAAEAAARANYFDLMFNVVANELGYDLNYIADNKVYSIGRTPNSPFVMSNVSREIVRNLLADLKYGDDKTKIKKNEIVSDRTAMDAFSSMKSFLPNHNDNIVETMIKSLAEVPNKVYIPAGLKAAIDLEIDAIIENGAFLQRCELCKDYYMRCEEYDFDYCDRASKSGRSCVEVMSDKKGMKQSKAFVNAEAARVTNAESIDAALLNERCERLYKEMSSRINAGFTQRDFSDWCRYLNTMRDNILNGSATLRDFENFKEYSKAMSFLPGSQGADRRDEVKDSKGRTVKPFVFERVDRREVQKAQPNDDDDFEYDGDYEKEAEVKQISPRVSSRIIRGVNPAVNEYSSGVVIPYGNEAAKRVEPVPQAPVGAVAPVEEDVKIYNVKPVKEPKKPDEFVKVFRPRREEKAQIPHIPQKTAKESPRTPAFTPAPALRPQSQAAQSVQPISNPKPTVAAVQEPRKIPAENPVNPAPTLNIPPASAAADKREQDKSRRYAASQKTYASQKAEETQEIGFAEMMRGFERRDGFEDEPGDSDGVPVSHKTKRVMDALFKPSKPSMFINVNKGDE